jgi:hypothetical protein
MASVGADVAAAPLTSVTITVTPTIGTPVATTPEKWVVPGVDESKHALKERAKLQAMTTDLIFIRLTFKLCGWTRIDRRVSVGWERVKAMTGCRVRVSGVEENQRCHERFLVGGNTSGGTQTVDVQLLPLLSNHHEKKQRGLRKK